MSLVSRFSGPRLHPSSVLNKRGRQPTHSRLSLEHLEERALLDATSGLIGGASSNLALNNNFNLASNGIILPIAGSSTGSSVANGADATHSLDFSGLTSNGAQAASSAFLAQNQPNAQFRLFAVNSQGQDFQLFQQTQLNFLSNSFGFGSGTMPNRPWMPAAYNVGLANHQFGFPSQSDLGFQSAPSWSYPLPNTVPIAQAQAKQPLGDEDVNTVEDAEQASVRQSMHQQEEVQPRRIDMDADDPNEDANLLRDNSASERGPVVDQALNQERSFPDALWLTVLPPAPMTALVAGLPGVAVETEGADAGASEAE